MLRFAVIIFDETIVRDLAVYNRMYRERKHSSENSRRRVSQLHEESYGYSWMHNNNLRKFSVVNLAETLSTNILQDVRHWSFWRGNIYVNENTVRLIPHSCWTCSRRPIIILVSYEKHPYARGYISKKFIVEVKSPTFRGIPWDATRAKDERATAMRSPHCISTAKNRVR